MQREGEKKVLYNSYFQNHWFSYWLWSFVCEMLPDHSTHVTTSETQVCIVMGHSTVVGQLQESSGADLWCTEYWNRGFLACSFYCNILILTYLSK